MDTLLDLLVGMPRLGDREAVRYYNGYRSWTISYEQLYSRSAAVAGYLKETKIKKGDRVLIWGSNRTAWVAAFWGCLARGVHIVPVDARFSDKLVRRIHLEVGAKLLIHGEEVPVSELEVRKLSFRELEKLPPLQHLDISPARQDDIVEIVYTSGTTGEPRGVVHRHRNICANLSPIEREIERYRWLARPFQPVRILDLLPLSHMYGQSLGIFIPLLLNGASVFMSDLNPGAIIEAIRRERVSVLVVVPRLVMSLQNEIRRRFDIPGNGLHRKGLAGVAEKWWRHRALHTALGWKFWAIVLGGAQLDPISEDFWHRVGVLVVQGYGLTETSPVVTVNHPFNAQRGSIGRVLPGQELRIAQDGEILVRGESVVDEYLGGAPGECHVSQSGWLHTGDLGRIDAEGRLYYRGRKKEVIVTSEGLNVYPDDVESVLNSFPTVAGSTVIGLHQNGEEIVHAVLILRESSAEVESLVRRANQQLESHQRIRSWSIWPDEDFPRTASTFKVRRIHVARFVSEHLGKGPSPPVPARMGTIVQFLSKMTGRDPSQLRSGLTLEEDMGLSSLEKVELLSQLQNKLGVEMDEGRFTQCSTIGELKKWLDDERQEVRTQPSLETGTAVSLATRLFSRQQGLHGDAESEEMPILPRWPWIWPVRWFRILFHHLCILPYYEHHIEQRIEGLSNLDGVEPPVIFAANHQSHLDTIALFSALPAFWRWRLAPAMGVEYFRPFFRPKGYPVKDRLIAAGQYFLATLLFNTYPFSQRMGGIRPTLKYTGEVVQKGFCPLVYPEGKRTPNGKLLPFRSGIGFMAAKLDVVVIPVYLEGLFEIYSIHHSWPELGPVVVRIGSPLVFEAGQDYEGMTQTVERAVRRLSER